MTALSIVDGYFAAAWLCVLAIRRAGRETVRASRFERLVDEDGDWR